MLYAQLQTILPHFNSEKIEIENIVYSGEKIYQEDTIVWAFRAYVRNFTGRVAG